jgi:hypothetical protein
MTLTATFTNRSRRFARDGRREAPASTTNPEHTNNYLSGGEKKLARYRWNFLKRAVGETVNNYTNVYRLVDTANALLPGDYTANMDAIVDTEEWMRIFGVEHATGTGTVWATVIAEHVWLQTAARQWTLMMWDYNIVLGNSGSYGPDGNNLFQHFLEDRTRSDVAFLRHPKSAGQNCARSGIADDPMQSFNVGPVMDAKYDAFVASGITVTAPTAVKTWTRRCANRCSTQ